VKRLYSLLFKKLRQLVDFHQPRFRHLDCIDLVLENKLLFLLSWDVVHASKICIHPGKIVYRRSVSAAICRLPAGTESVDIILHNVWRSKKVSFRLKQITVDRQTLLLLDELFLKKLALSNIYIPSGFTTIPIQFKKQLPQVSLVMQIPEFNLSINQFQLNDYAP
jgi:hypothetical protein